MPKWTPEDLDMLIERVRYNMRGPTVDALTGEDLERDLHLEPKFASKNKTGGKSPRTKGFSFERECVKIAKAAGHEAKRTPCSRYPDLRIDNRPVSCKRRKASYKWMYVELTTHDYILCRDDNGEILKIKKWKP